MKQYTWNELFDAAIGSGFCEPSLKAKDEARLQASCMMIDLGYPDPDEEEVPEDAIESFCKKACVIFDEKGNIIGSVL